MLFHQYDEIIKQINDIVQYLTITWAMTIAVPIHPVNECTSLTNVMEFFIANNHVNVLTQIRMFILIFMSRPSSADKITIYLRRKVTKI